MEAIDCMQKGSLTEEYRLTQVDGETVRLGPYYKYQVWEGGKNISKRVPADKAPELQRSIAGLDKFKQLCKQYIDTTIEMTEATDAKEQASKKNARKLRKANIKKQKPS